MTPRLILASASPARRELLRAAGVTAEVVVSGVDEERIEAQLVDASPARLAQVLANAKARAVADGLAAVDGPTVVVGCDTILDLDGVALGRPTDATDARARWAAMRSRSGVLLTGHSVIRLDVPGEVGAVGTTVVHFGDPTDEEVATYVASGEPTSVAGAFTIDGLGGAFIDGIEGDPANVAGLSLPLLRRLLSQVGLDWVSLWPATGRPDRWPVP